jgi:hypothetical protein
MRVAYFSRHHLSEKNTQLERDLRPAKRIAFADTSTGESKEGGKNA